MTDHPRLSILLDELLDSGATPDEVCRSCPELLPEVRKRWRDICQIRNHLDVLFPTAPESDVIPADASSLPTIPGYEVDALLGRGGMGVVFRARHLRLNRFVALKMALGREHTGLRERERFQREVKAAATLRHPNIVQIYEVGDHAGRPYFTMELVEGGSLAQKLARSLPPPRAAAELVASLAVTVQFAHRSGVIHRDLKPANILLAAQPAKHRAADDAAAWGEPKITDFGLARFIDDPKLTCTGMRLGTPSYMAPEKALGETAEVGPAADVYALGVILYEALTGRPPFAGPTATETERRLLSEEPVLPSRLNPKVSRDLDTICLKCLRKTPARRYASAQDLADDLHRFLDGKPVLARPVGTLERVVKWARRHPAMTVAAASLLVLVTTSVS